jgi:hypothetical protein
VVAQHERATCVEHQLALFWSAPRGSNAGVRQLAPGVYVRRSPAESPFFEVLKSHLLEFLTAGAPSLRRRRVPGFVEQDLRDFLACGEGIVLGD